MVTIRRHRVIILFILSFLFHTYTLAQDIDVKNNSYFYPHRLEAGSFFHTLGLRLASLPEDIVESDDAFRAPLISYSAKIGLTENFLAEGGFETNLITLHLILGPKWTHEFGRLNFSIGGDAAYFLGALHQFDFRTKIHGWKVYPNLSLGYLFRNFSVTLKSELVLVLDQTVKTGDVEVTSDFKTLSGYSFTLFLEQPLWKENFVVLGIKANITKFYYPMWITFSTFDRFFFIPELLLSFNL